MINQIAGIGVMSVLGSPMMIKLLPKAVLGTVVRKVATHYLQSGQHLQEAMREATEEVFTALNMGLKPTVFRKVVSSKASKEFVQQFKEGYLEAFFEENQGLDREAFLKESSKACRKILKELDHLIEPIVPVEEDVHRFFSQGEMNRIDQRMNEGELRLIKKLNELDEVKPPFLALMRFEHLLFQGIHYFFRQKIAERPAVKAIFDELSQLKAMRSVEEAKQQRTLMQSQLIELQKSVGELTAQLKNASGDNAENLRRKQNASLEDEQALKERLALLQDDMLEQTQAQWNQFNRNFQGFEKKLGAQIELARDDIRQARDQIIYEIAKIDVHLEQQDRALDEIRSLLYSLVRRGSSENDYIMTASSMVHRTFHGKSSNEWKPLVREAASGAGLSSREVEQIVSSASQGPSVQRQKVPHAVFEVMGQDDSEARSFTVYFADKVSVGRHSRNDLVLYWYPLPDPPDQHNIEWRNWRGSGECHPTLNISGTHLEFEWFGGTLHLRDRSSKGTFVNREPVRKGKLVSLREGALISAANVVTLSYSLLEDENDKPIGWRLRRMNNAQGREEYMFIESGAEISLGASSMDAIAFSAPGLKPTHLRIRREGEKLILMPGKHACQLNGEPLEAEQAIESGSRIEIGDQVIWCFPPS